MMTTHIWSAHEIGNTRLCIARNCEDDALTGWSLCARHDRQHRAGRTVELHAAPTQLEPTLRCSSCTKWKPDRYFSITTKAVGGPPIDRRGRHFRCQECVAIDQAKAEGEMP